MTPKLNNTVTGPGYIVGDLVDTIAGLTPADALYGRFEGINALLDYQAEHQKTAKQREASDQAKDPNKSFNYFDNYNTAVKVYRNNPASICEFKQDDTYLDGGDVSGRDIEYDVTGDCLDVGRYLSGEPEVFSSLTNGNPRNKRVNIFVDFSIVWSTNKDSINARGARIVRLVDWLESQGVRTQVTYLNSHEAIRLEVVVKHFDEPLAITDIAVASHSDWLRRVIFRFQEYSKIFNSGYGTSTKVTNHMSQHPSEYASEYNDELTVLIKGGDRLEYLDIPGIDLAFDRLETQLAKQLSKGEEAGQDRVLTVL